MEVLEEGDDLITLACPCYNNLDHQPFLNMGRPEGLSMHCRSRFFSYRDVRPNHATICSALAGETIPQQLPKGTLGLVMDNWSVC